MKLKHTPLPWHVEGGLRCTVVAHKHNYVIASDVATDNAAYIVRACNAYPKMVAALRGLVKAEEAYGDESNVAVNHEWLRARDCLREIGEE